MIDFPESITPLADPRRITAELANSHYLMQRGRGLITESMEPYVDVPQTEAIDPSKAHLVTTTFLGWMINDIHDGLVSRTTYEPASTAVANLGYIVSQYSGTSKADVEAVVQELQAADELTQRVYEETGDGRAWDDRDIIVLARKICADLKDENENGIKDVLMGQSKDSVYRKLGTVLTMLDRP